MATKGKPGLYARLPPDVYREWARTSALHRRAFPYCAKCLKQGLRTLGTVTDHIVPHRGDRRLLFDPANRQTLCDVHHNSTKKREEFHGVVLGCDEEGTPLDPNHAWNKRRPA